MQVPARTMHPERQAMRATRRRGTDRDLREGSLPRHRLVAVVEHGGEFLRSWYTLWRGKTQSLIEIRSRSLNIISSRHFQTFESNCRV